MSDLAQTGRTSSRRASATSSARTSTCTECRSPSACRSLTSRTWPRGPSSTPSGPWMAWGSSGPNEDECVGVPDLAALTVLPWDTRYAIAAADLYLHGQPYTPRLPPACCDARWRRRTAMGYRCRTWASSPRCTCCVEPGRRLGPVRSPRTSHNLPTRGYDLETTMLADRFLEPMVDHMNELGWDVYSFDHEGGDGQYEFDFGYTDALEMADRMLIFRLMAKHVASSTRLHRHASCPSRSSDGVRLGRPTSTSASPTRPATEPVRDGRRRAHQRRAIAASRGTGARLPVHRGCPRARGRDHRRARPTVNSYKRLLPRGLMNEISWAPVFRAYGYNNRTLMSASRSTGGASSCASPTAPQLLPRDGACARRRARRHPARARRRRPGQHRHLHRQRRGPDRERASIGSRPRWVTPSRSSKPRASPGTYSGRRCTRPM